MSTMDVFEGGTGLPRKIVKDSHGIAWDVNVLEIVLYAMKEHLAADGGPEDGVQFYYDMLREEVMVPDLSNPGAVAAYRSQQTTGA